MSQLKPRLVKRICEMARNELEPSAEGAEERSPPQEGWVLWNYESRAPQVRHMADASRAVPPSFNPNVMESLSRARFGHHYHGALFPRHEGGVNYVRHALAAH
jgi:hypothetical protein